MYWTTYLAVYFRPCLLAGCIIGIAWSVFEFLYIRIYNPQQIDHARRTATADMSVVQSKRLVAMKEPSTHQQPCHIPAQIYAGVRFNPRFGEWFDIKMWLYLAGAIMLQLVILSAAALQYHQYGSLSTAMIAYNCMFSWFICDYLLNERIHLWTYDIFAEKIGFKLIWGCLCFYSFLYPMGVWCLIDAPAEGSLTTWQLGACFACFFCGWGLSRGANNQKFAYRSSKQPTFLCGLIKQEAVGDRLLCSGFWGMSHHINYLGEILMATGLALPGVFSNLFLVPLMYPLYYVCLLFPREREDHAVCRLKYGPLWDEYTRRVRYRIIPYVY
jgi:Delta14-sterol reductase